MKLGNLNLEKKETSLKTKDVLAWISYPVAFISGLTLVNLVESGNLYWLIPFIPAIIYTIWNIYLVIKNQK